MKTKLLIITGTVVTIAAVSIFLAFYQEIQLATDLVEKEDGPQSSTVSNQDCAKLFDKIFDTWEEHVEKNYGGPGQPVMEPPTVEGLISGWWGGEEFRKTDCRYRVNDWAYLVRHQDQVWGNVDWPQLEPFSQKEPTPLEKLLIQNQIDYRPDMVIVSGGLAFGGDPGCGVVMDVDNRTHWFAINSISQPTEITLYSENPNQCKVNTSSCVCNVQMELTALTLKELSYFTPEEEEKYANILIDYLGKENINRTPKFLIGKFNLNYTDPSAIGYCGELWGYNTIDYFDGAIVNDQVEDYGLARELSPLCAISNNAKWRE